jgi:DNA-nicking Smr family endonuclease
VIDLHGMTQAEAHSVLIQFLYRAQASGHAIVLVVTGKGSGGLSDVTDSHRGVLRRMVPHWLTLPDLRAVVLGFEEAGPRQGGGGALYVRLRRPRGHH